LDPYLEGVVFSDVEMMEDEEEEMEHGELGVGEEVFTERKKLMPY
jgi:hypothetical protein